MCYGGLPYIGIKIENFEFLLLIKIEKKQVKNIALLNPLSKTEIEKQYATILQFKIMFISCSKLACVYLVYSALVPVFYDHREQKNRRLIYTTKVLVEDNVQRLRNLKQYSRNSILIIIDQIRYYL